MSEQSPAAMLKALGDDHRIQILKLLHGGEKCACELLEELDISQPTLSHHMKILCDAGLVSCRKDGKWNYYEISCEGVCALRSFLRDLLAPELIPEHCRCE